MRSYVVFMSAIAAISGALLCGGANAATSGAYRADPREERIQLEAPTLAPMAYARFCLEYREECAVHRMRSAIGLTRQRWAELVRINADVNRAIVPQANDEGVLAERWLVAPRAGDCHDYAVTKRHELMARGWPSRALLLAEVVTSWGEHHLVLVIRTRDGDFVADNLNANIRPWFTSRYRWVRMQSPQNPMFWSTVADVSTLSRAPILANANLGRAQSDILIEADETEVAMAENVPATGDQLAEVAPQSSSSAVDLVLAQGNRETPAFVAPAIVDPPMLLAGNASADGIESIVDETQHGFGAAPKAATEDQAIAVTSQIATQAVVQFGYAATEVWKRQFVWLLSIGGFTATA
jgi:predicted transglutaminase-like cysteine proteinase